MSAEDSRKDTHELSVVFVGDRDAIDKAWWKLRGFMDDTGVSLKAAQRGKAEQIGRGIE